DVDFFVQIAPVKIREVDQLQESRQSSLCNPHARCQAVWMAVRPAHAAPCASTREMCPLHVPEILIVEFLRQRAAMVLEHMDRTMLAVEKRSVRRRLEQCLPDQSSRRE